MPKWTDEQKRAIDAHGHTVLVSAAAGSGKTAVLVERILRLVTDKEHPVDIDRFLIVTFTRAAASEMRGKISDALTAALLQDPRSHHLRSQLTRLSRADILTTDAFCTKLLREHFQAVGLTPDFRVLDENEASALQREVLEELIEDKYERADENPGFLALVEALSAARDDKRLGEVVLDLYRKLQSHPFPAQWLARNISDMESAAQLDPAESIYGKVLLSELSDACAYHASRLADACAQIAEIEVIRPKYMSAFSQDLARCRALSDALKAEAPNWDDVRALILSCAEKPRLGAVLKFPGPALLEGFRQIRDDYHDALDSFSSGPFAHDAEKTRADCARILPVMEALTQTVSDFMTAFSQRKRAMNALDFSDLEHFALDLLIESYSPEGFTPSAAAQEIGARYAEIAVDEFQDSNLVQDLIFRALSRQEENLFLVGDVKQSIYGFRLADPGVFMEKYDRFSDDPASGESERITLSRNFRSRREVIESVNYIFKNILSPALGGITYAGREALVYGADYPEIEQDADDAAFLLVEDPKDGRDKVACQADVIAARIGKMLREGFLVTDSASRTLRPCRPDDFAILLRSMTGRAEVFSAALAKAGIPVQTENAGQLFDGPEILALMALAEVVDNPDQDVALAAALHSPLYAFSADELAGIRLCLPKGSFYAALRACAEEGEDEALCEKCRAFLSDLSDFRSHARDERADALLVYMLDKTNFLGRFGAAFGEEFSRTRLQAFLSAASRSENSGYRGLYAFLNLMRALRDGQGIPAPAQAQGAGVRIMSIHKSKGLEFPVVFVANLESPFNMQDLNEPVLIHPRLGAGFKLRPEGRMIEYPTLARYAVQMTLRRESLSEQMRVYYVALTRAKEKLFLVAYGEKENLVKKYRTLRALSPIPAQALSAFSSPLPWFFAPLLRLPAAAGLQQDAGFPAAPAEESNACWQIEDVYPAPADDARRDDAQTDGGADLPISAEELYAHLSYVYPALSAANLPSKMTATGLKGRFADAEVHDEAREMHASRPAPHAIPRALRAQKLTPAQRGTALHMAMQFLDFSRAGTREAIDAQVREMAEKKLLSAESAQAVDTARLYAFFRSSLGKAMQSADSVRREFKFSILADARALSEPALLAAVPDENADTILFQGVIDCFFEDADGITVVDFKSDRVTPASVDSTARGYTPQVNAYASALSRITGKPIKAKYLYFFALDLPYPLA